jgi:hypothetical protein
MYLNNTSWHLCTYLKKKSKRNDHEASNNDHVSNYLIYSMLKKNEFQNVKWFHTLILIS